MTIQPGPDGFHTITPYLAVGDAARLLQFLRDAFDAEETERLTLPDGRIMHAEVKIGDSTVMIGQARGDWTPMLGSNYLFVTDTDAVYDKALAAGATSLMEPADQFYGDRNAGVEDPLGNLWWIGTRIERLSKEEMQRRAEQIYAKSEH